MQPTEFFEALWRDFSAIAPRAVAIKALLEARGETVENDHVAFRTFDRSPISLDQLEPLLLGLGYSPLDDYTFPDKHLRARAYLNPGWPRIFLSELLVDRLSERAKGWVETCVGQVDASLAQSPSAFYAGRPWAPLSFEVYTELAAESEYAAWLCALGLRPNHFTVSVNALKALSTLPLLLDFVAGAGYALNTAGGRIKGSREVFLEQGSTLADRVPVQFSDGIYEIPTCYYEFALRHVMPDGRLYEGFVTTSADKIFESTHRGEAPAAAREVRGG